MPQLLLPDVPGCEWRAVRLPRLDRPCLFELERDGLLIGTLVVSERWFDKVATRAITEERP